MPVRLTPNAPDTPLVSDVDDAALRQFVGYNMKRAFNVVQADLTQTLKPLGLRMLTYTALVLIVENPGLSQSQLAAAMDVERPNLVEIIDELEQRALVLRRRVPADRRIYALTATPEGIQLCQKALAADKAHEARLFEEIPSQTIETMIETMQTVRTRGALGAK